MINVLNKKHQSYIDDKWKQHCIDQSRANKEITDCGVGWLTGIAAHANLCCASGQDKNNVFWVCAADLWNENVKSDSPYFCKGHQQENLDYLKTLPEYNITDPNHDTKSFERLNILLRSIREKLKTENQPGF